jgi:integrase
MAKAVKRGDSWFVQFRRAGVSESKSFPTSAQANAWRAKKLLEFTANKFGAVPNVAVSDLFARYGCEISPLKRGARWEVIRLNTLSQDALASVMLPKLDQPDIARWRDRRLLSVSNAAVNRDWNLLSHVFTVAINEWRMLGVHPMKGVRRPPDTKARTRMPSPDEIERLRFVMRDDGSTVQSKAFLCFLFAIETGMRAGEIAGLKTVTGNVASLLLTKNGDAREVPLSPAAVALYAAHGPFGISVSQIDAAFRKGMKLAMIEGLHFHDSRHLAITRLSEKLEILELARAVGMRNLRELMTYYNKPASEIAKKLI